MDIKAGVVIVTKFCKPGAKEFKEYIDYVNRDEAIRNDNMSAFNLYQDYMDNPEKTTGLFTSERSDLSKEEKEKVKEIFKLAQKNGSLMWQNVISFDNAWLEKNGLYNSETKFLDKETIENVTRKSMSVLQKKEGLENAFWSAAIHYNTDNIHVHIAMVEPDPQRQIQTNGSGIGERRGKYKLGSITAAKSSVVNSIINNQPENQLINQIIRHNIIDNKKEMSIFKDSELANQFLKIYSTMPDDKRLWNYKSNAITNQRTEIDKLSDMFIEKYNHKDLLELIDALDKQEMKYNEAYGKPISSYKQNKLNDLHYRLGNVILKEMKAYDYSEKERIYNELRSKNQKRNERALKTLRKNGKLKNTAANRSNLRMRIETLKYLLQHEIQSRKNQYQYELMKREEEWKKLLEERENNIEEDSF